MTNLHDLAGRHNMAATYVRLAMGEAVRIAEPYDYAEGYYVVRSVDTPPAVFHADQLFTGIEDATWAERRAGAITISYIGTVIDATGGTMGEGFSAFVSAKSGAHRSPSSSGADDSPDCLEELKAFIKKWAEHCGLTIDGVTVKLKKKKKKKKAK